MEWVTYLSKKKELIAKAFKIMGGRDRIDAVELAEKLNMSVEDFNLLLSNDLITLAPSKGFKVIFGSYDKENGTITERITRGENTIIIPIFIRYQ